MKKREAKTAVKQNDKTIKDAAATGIPVSPVKLTVVTTNVKNGVFVDSKCPRAVDYEVVFDGSTALSCYLMWSDIKENHNKFYVAQAL